MQYLHRFMNVHNCMVSIIYTLAIMHWNSVQCPILKVSSVLEYPRMHSIDVTGTVFFLNSENVQYQYHWNSFQWFGKHQVAHRCGTIINLSSINIISWVGSMFLSNRFCKLLLVSSSEFEDIFQAG